MRVLFVAPLPEPVTGQSLACAVLLSALRSRHAVDVVDLKKESFRDGASSIKRIIEVLVATVRVAVLALRCDAIYLTVSQSRSGNIRDLMMYLVCFYKLNKMTIHLHGGAAMERLLSTKHPFIRYTNRFFLRRISAVIVLGESLAPIFHGLVPSSRIYCVPNFAEDYLFLNADEVAEKYSSIYPLRLLFLSNLLEGKGHKELLQAMKLLPAEVLAKIELDVAGAFESHEDEMAFHASAAELSCVRYHGTVHGARKASLFARAHLFCLPTYYRNEGQPISILEAYSSGCAVLTTNHGGIYDIFTPGKNGFGVEKASVASIASALSLAVSSSARLCDMGQTNLAMACKRFRVAKYCEALISIIECVGGAKVGSQKY